ncbi:MAG: response regulator [Planctomycetes bacterium]|nr:response regulator [Planctomycetota bacterium]
MSDPQKVNLLLVDDDPKILLALDAILRAPDRHLVQARSGEEALRLLLDQEFAVILLDVKMPGMDGFETAGRIRERDRCRHTPILFVTAYGREKQQVFRGYSVGAVDYIFTPIEPEILQAKVSIFVELFCKSRELDRRAQELARFNQELEAFTYTVSHDLRAPLRAAEGFAALLQREYEGRLDEPGLEYLRQINGAVGRMEALIRDLLAYSRISREDLRPHAVDLGLAIAEALGLLEGEVRSTQGRIVLEEPNCTVLGDPTTLAQVVVNLVSNALKFVAAGVQPRVRIRAEAGEERVRLWVEDNGIGIEPKYHERIFQVFERLHSTEAYPGTGIGLAIVRRGVERMGGTVGLESVPNGGSRFWIELPKGRPKK